jgi:hypothetical protein
VGGFSGGLHHDVDGAYHRIRPLDRQGNALALLVQPQNDDWPGFCFRAIRGASMTKRLIPGAIKAA